MSGVPLRIVNQRAYDAAREAARLHLAAIRGYEPLARQVDALTAATIGAYLAVMTGERTANQRVAQSTRAMAHMAVGDTLDIRAASRSCLRANMKTARRLMTNPKASWALHETDTGRIRVTRLADGSQPQRDPWSNLRAVQIARLHPQQSALCDAFPSVHALAMNTKVAARRLLDNPEANWSARTTSKGVRITRTR